MNFGRIIALLVTTSISTLAFSDEPIFFNGDSCDEIISSAYTALGVSLGGSEQADGYCQSEAFLDGESPNYTKASCHIGIEGLDKEHTLTHTTSVSLVKLLEDATYIDSGLQNGWTWYRFTILVDDNGEKLCSIGKNYR
jgi:hypothetical protein